jgi:hypothetical protein
MIFMIDNKELIEIDMKEAIDKKTVIEVKEIETIEIDKEVIEIDMIEIEVIEIEIEVIGIEVIEIEVIEIEVIEIEVIDIKDLEIVVKIIEEVEISKEDNFSTNHHNFNFLSQAYQKSLKLNKFYNFLNLKI